MHLSCIIIIIIRDYIDALRFVINLLHTYMAKINLQHTKETVPMVIAAMATKFISAIWPLN